MSRPFKNITEKGLKIKISTKKSKSLPPAQQAHCILQREELFVAPGRTRCKNLPED